MCSAKPWMDSLPVVLLGLRTAFKEDLQATPTEMLYGTSLRIPGDFFLTTEQQADPRMFIDKHRELMQALRPTPTAHHNQAKMFILKDLQTCSHVFIRADHTRRPLEPPYMGPYKIINRLSDRVYQIQIDGKSKNISIERIKPAYVNKTDDDDDQEPVEAVQQPIHKWQSNVDPPKHTYKKLNETMGSKRRLPARIASGHGMSNLGSGYFARKISRSKWRWRMAIYNKCEYDFLFE
ncbi:uncharacterized protein [Prorops nasuta]|uniref:uncharacterized protein n=1 Tax=Prorops nasuta TaxID=863751 RepID=UPI0034CE6BA7